MSQIASKIRSLVASRKGLKDCVGICDAFQVGKKGDIKAHLDSFTQEDKPLLGNPAHPELLFDECEQLIVPLEFADHFAVAVIKFSVKEDKRKAFIQYFNARGTDLSDDLLASLSGFFTENHYEVLYHCISGSIVKKGISDSKITCYKAIDLANQNAGISENLSATLVESKEETKEQKTKTPDSQNNKKQSEPTAQGSWLVILLAVGCVIYLGSDYIKPYTAALMALVPTNPILAYMAFGGVFFLGWLLIAGLQHLSRERETPALKPRQVVKGDVNETCAPQKRLLNAFENVTEEPVTNNEALNKEATASMRSLRLN